jgi:hypothetical protein
MKYLLSIIALSLSLSSLAQGISYSMVYLDFGSTKADLPSGDGDLKVTVNNKNEIIGLTVGGDVNFDGEGYTETSINMQSLLEGKAFSYYAVKEPKANDVAIFKIVALENFGVTGGQVRISVRKKSGWVSEILNLKRHPQTVKYQVWKGTDIIDQLDINIQGMKLGTDMTSAYVGWYEFILR